MGSIAFIPRLKTAGRLIASLRCGLLMSAGAALVAGCSADERGEPGRGSMFGTRTVPTRVVVVGEDQAPHAFPSLSLSGSPVSVVQKAFRVVQDDYKRKMQVLEERLAHIRNQWHEVDSQVSEAREAIASDYNALRPSAASGQFATRDPLEGLSKARAEKSKADSTYQEGFSKTIKPLEEELARLANEESNVQSSMSSLRKGLADELFNALPSPPAAQWKTDSEGKQTMEIPQDEPWCIWAQGSRRVATTVVTDSVVNPSTGRGSSVSRAGGHRTTIYRWVLIVPESLDSSGSLCLDATNVYDGAIVSRIAQPGSDYPVLRRD